VEDGQIIDLYWTRDQRAIQETEGKYGRLLHSIAWNLLRSREDSEECVNDTYLRAWNAIPPQRPGALRAWLARITRIPGIEAAGIQTNLSVGAKKVLEDFTGQGGELEKLRIWATFHPEMTKIQEFSRDVKEISQAGIHICAGAVGAPEYLEGLKELKKALPKEVYLWINAMDGLKRPYSQEEIRQWEEIDPYFSRELFTPPGNKEVCRERLLVEGDGRLRICNISPVLGKS